MAGQAAALMRRAQGYHTPWRQQRFPGNQMADDQTAQTVSDAMYHRDFKGLHQRRQHHSASGNRAFQAGIGKQHRAVTSTPQPVRQQGHTKAVHVQAVDQYHCLLRADIADRFQRVTPRLEVRINSSR